MGKNREFAKEFVKKYCCLHEVNESLFQEPYFDLPEWIDEKVELECTSDSTEYFDQIELHCDQHLMIEKDKIVWKDLSSYTAFWYQILEDGKRMKTKLQIFQEQKENHHVLTYQKEISWYLNFGLETKKVIRHYAQNNLDDVQLNQILSCFPMDPDLWNMPFTDETILTRSLDMDTVKVLFTSFQTYPYQFELPLTLESSQDLFCFRFLDNHILEKTISSILNHQTIILPEIEDISERKKHLLHLIGQITDVTLQQKIIDYYNQDPVCDTEHKLKLTYAYFL